MNPVSIHKIYSAARALNLASSFAAVIPTSGWFSAAAAGASRRNLASYSGRNLSATWRPQPKVFSLVHHTHAAATELANYAVMGDPYRPRVGREWLLTGMLGRSGSTATPFLEKCREKFATDSRHLTNYGRVHQLHASSSPFSLHAHCK
jgi:hypothetical protein